MDGSRLLFRAAARFNRLWRREFRRFRNFFARRFFAGSVGIGLGVGFGILFSDRSGIRFAIGIPVGIAFPVRFFGSGGDECRSRIPNE